MLAFPFPSLALTTTFTATPLFAVAYVLIWRCCAVDYGAFHVWRPPSFSAVMGYSVRYWDAGCILLSGRGERQQASVILQNNCHGLSHLTPRTRFLRI
jgi:hypothetical protein